MLANYFLRPQTISPPSIINGRDLMKGLRLKEGPRIGQLLKAIQEAQAIGKVSTREQALKMAINLMNKPMQSFNKELQDVKKVN